MKKIAFIPPNGEIVNQDFALYRIIKFFEAQGYLTSLLCVKHNHKQSINYDTNIITVDNKEDIITYLDENEFDLIFHRSWMHRYSFAVELINKFANIVIYIKDWQNIPKNEYTYLYKTKDDFQSIKKILSSNCILLTHYQEKYIDKLCQYYNIKKRKSHFFPEYCNKDSFYTPTKKYFNKNNIKILFASGINKTSLPMQASPAKSVFKMLTTISKQNIYIDLMLLPKSYKKVFNDEIDLFQDYIYEHTFNDFFTIKKGSDLNHRDTDKYNFGIFAGLDFNTKGLYVEAESYAVTSKFAFYLESGLPILVHKRFKLLSKIVKKNHIGLIYDDNDLLNFKSFLNISKKDYNQLLINVSKFREVFSYNKKTMYSIINLLKDPNA